MKNISRESSFIYSFTQSFTPFLSRGACLFSLLLFPAMFFSCIQAEDLSESENEDTLKMHVKSSISSACIHTLDAFVFNPDGTMDCYQRIENPGSAYTIASGSGAKTLLLIANSSRDRYEWSEIRNINTIANLTCNLEDEKRNMPVMTCLKDVTAGEESFPDMLPLRSEIVLQTIRCDFSGKPYEGERLTDVRVYLTYVNASSCIVPSDRNTSLRMINPGMLDEHCLETFKEKDIIMQSLNEDIGPQAVKAACSLFCYANSPGEESIGSPYTKLVIEGKIGSDTYYYPVKINPEGGGVAPGGRYVFDIVITRTGATAPDGNLNEEDIEINMEIEQWREKEWYEIKF